MEKFLTMFMTLQARLVAGREADQGQGTLEYVGMIIVASILVVAVLQVTGNVDLGAVFEGRIQDVVNFGG